MSSVTSSTDMPSTTSAPVPSSATPRVPQLPTPVSRNPPTPVTISIDTLLASVRRVVQAELAEQSSTRQGKSNAPSTSMDPPISHQTTPPITSSIPPISTGTSPLLSLGPPISSKFKKKKKNSCIHSMHLGGHT